MFLAFYSGDAKIYDQRKLSILIKESKSPSSKHLRYNLEDRLMSLNGGQFVYSVLVFDCPRPIVTEKRTNIKAVKSTIALKTNSQGKTGGEEESVAHSVIMIYSCATNETE